MSMARGSAGGGRSIAQHRDLLARIEAEYGVPGPIIVAIFGHETSYGRVKGDFDLARSLATLAWEGRRRELFAGEFVALMKIADKGYDRSQLVGSYAGAFGNPQFLPSVYLRLATDGDGDGRADIFTNRADTFRLNRQLFPRCRMAARAAVGRACERA
jgi:membrane-bound lytic murein transglycosylase B